MFTADLTQLQEKFIECGPSSVGNDLDQGLLNGLQVYAVFISDSNQHNH